MVLSKTSHTPIVIGECTTTWKQCMHARTHACTHARMHTHTATYKLPSHRCVLDKIQTYRIGLKVSTDSKQTIQYVHTFHTTWTLRASTITVALLLQRGAVHTLTCFSLPFYRSHHIQAFGKMQRQTSLKGVATSLYIQCVCSVK